MRFSEFRRLGLLTARDAGDTVFVFEVRFSERGEELSVERANELFDEAAGVDEVSERGGDFAAAGELRHRGGDSVYSRDAGAAHLGDGLGIQADDLAAHAVTPADAVEIFQVRRDRAAR